MTDSFDFEIGALGTTTARLYRAQDPKKVTLVLAHGAGASQAHPFMIDMAARLAKRGIDVVTFDFLYMTQQRKLPDRAETLEATWRAAIASVRAREGLPTGRLFIGGKSMGGRIASHIGADARGIVVDGLVFLGYPLRPPPSRQKGRVAGHARPVVRRDAHLPHVPFPMLFVQGTRDELGTSADIAALLPRLQRAELHVVEDGDHSLGVRKRENRDAQEQALEGVADAVARFVERA